MRPHSPAPGKGSHILLSFLLSVRAGVFYCRKAVTTVPSITPKQERFCQEYIIDYNGAKAAIRAGYAENSARKTASRLLTNADILARVRELQREQTARLALTQDYVLQQLVDTYRCCREPEPVLVYDTDAGGMVESGKYQFDSKGALRALELIGKVIFAVWLVPVWGYRAVCFCEPTTWIICFVFILLAVWRCRSDLQDACPPDRTPA